MNIPHNYYYSKDHLGRSASHKGGAFIAQRRKNIRSVATNDPATGVISEVQQTHYYPFGGIIAGISSGRSVQNRLYNGKELDTSNNLWWYDYGARQYDPTAPRFNRPDRFSEKYYSLNMYGYCGYNPVNRIDINGDSIWVNIGKTNLLFNKGIMYNSDGSIFNKKNKFAKMAVKALNNIISNGGNGVIETLAESDKNFIIRKGNNEFAQDNTRNATILINADNNHIDTSFIQSSAIGSGGTIKWNPSSKHGGPDSTGSSKRDSYIGLAHELGHALDASQGRLDLRRFAPNHPNVELRSVTYSEFNAMRFENIIRKNSQKPLRIAYSVDSNNNLFMEL